MFGKTLLTKSGERVATTKARDATRRFARPPSPPARIHHHHLTSVLPPPSRAAADVIIPPSLPPSLHPPRDVVRPQVLGGKIVAVYFGASWCGPCRAFLPTLTKISDALRSRGALFEVVYASSDNDDAEFAAHFTKGDKMPTWWFAHPSIGGAFAESRAWTEAMGDFGGAEVVKGVPHVSLFDASGKPMSGPYNACGLLQHRGVDGFPWAEPGYVRAAAENASELMALEKWKPALAAYEDVAELLKKARFISHWSPYDRVRAVHAVP